MIIKCLSALCNAYLQAIFQSIHPLKSKRWFGGTVFSMHPLQEKIRLTTAHTPKQSETPSFKVHKNRTNKRILHDAHQSRNTPMKPPYTTSTNHVTPPWSPPIWHPPHNASVKHILHDAHQSRNATVKRHYGCLCLRRMFRTSYCYATTCNFRTRMSEKGP